MAEIIGTFETGHTGPVHDTQLDYYGRRLATASSDHTIRIFDVSTDQPIFLAELKGHEGPVWQVCWAHPTFGNVLVSCSYDKKVLVWKETQRAHWEIVYSCEDFSSSINGVSWCPWDYGLQFACAIADGSIAVCSYNPETRSWTKKQVFGHPNGANSVSWAPATNSVGNSGVNPQNQPVRLVSGGCDNQIRIWKQDPQTKELTQMNQTLDIAHSEWVRDVAWRPSVDLLAETIASCGDDKIVVIWTQDADGQGWHSSQILNFNEPVWRVSWSVTGTVLAASSGEDVVTLFKENSEGKWEILTNISNNEQFTNNISCNSNIEPNSTNQTLGGNSPKNPMNNGELILSQNHQIKAQNANSQSPNKLESFGKIENISEISKNSSSEHHSISNCNFSPSQMQKPNISQQNYSSPVASQTNVIQNPINTCVSPPLQNHATNSPQPVKLNNFLNNNSNLVPSTHSNVSNKDSTNLTNPPTMHDISNASLVHNKISSILNGTSQNLNNQGSSQNQFQVASNQDFQNSLSSAPPPNKPNLSGYNSSFAVINQSSDGSTAPPKFTVPQPTMINSSGNNFGSIPPPPPPPPPGVRRYPGIQ